MGSRRQGRLVAERSRASLALSWFAAVLLVTVGVGGLAAALDAQRSLDELAAHGVPVTGMLLSAGVTGSDRAGVVAQFTTADGELVVASSTRFDRGVIDLAHADPLDILYDADDPTVFQGASWSPPQSLPWLGAGWLVLTVGVAAATLARARRNRARRNWDAELAG